MLAIHVVKHNCLVTFPFHVNLSLHFFHNRYGALLNLAARRLVVVSVCTLHWLPEYLLLDNLKHINQFLLFTLSAILMRIILWMMFR